MWLFPDLLVHIHGVASLDKKEHEIWTEELELERISEI